MPQSSNLSSVFNDANAELSGTKPKSPTPSKSVSSSPLNDIFAQAHAELNNVVLPPTRPPAQPAPLSEFPENATAGDIAKTQAGNVAIGALEPFSARDVSGQWKLPGALNVIPSALGAAKDIVMGQGTAKAQQLLKGAIEGPIQPIRQLTSGDWQQAAEGAGGFLTTTVPAVEALSKGVRGVKNAMVSTAPAQLFRARAIQSILQPNKSAFDFGADPVKEVANLPPTSSIDKMHQAIREAIADKETQLQAAVMKPTAPGPRGAMDVESLIRSQAQPILEQATRWGRGSTIKMVNKALDAYLDDLRTRRGGTTLSGADILAEKRLLNKEIKFTPNDVKGQNLNALKMGVYRALDKGMDLMNPEVSDINNSYSGLVEADHLLKQQKLYRGNAPLTKKTAFETAVSVAPEIAAKTRTASQLTPRPSTSGKVLGNRTTAPLALLSARPSTAEEYLQKNQ